nr:hypothetical protein [Tanacetum cinerariifolium]
MKGAIGALDGTLVHAVVPASQQTTYRGRGGDKYYLCDAAYANTRGFLAPYRNTRYWLADFQRRRALTKEEKFNHAHAQLRNVIERSYGVLKARFPILKLMAPFNFLTQRNVVIACFAIHNFIRKFNIEDVLFLECDEDTITNKEEQHEGSGEEETNGSQWGTRKSMIGKLIDGEAKASKQYTLNLLVHDEIGCDAHYESLRQLETGTFTSIFKCPALKQLAIKRWDEYGFVIRSCLVGVTCESVRIDL